MNTTETRHQPPNTALGAMNASAATCVHTAPCPSVAASDAAAPIASSRATAAPCATGFRPAIQAAT